MTSVSPTMADGFVVHSNGRFNGGSYKINRDRMGVYLSVTLTDNASFYTNPDTIVARNGAVVYKRNFRFKWQKLLTDDPFYEYVLIGPGEVLLAPPMWGDIIPIHLDGMNEWMVGRSGPLAMTDGITTETRSQPLFRNVLAREATFVYRISGTGVIFVTSLGSLQQRLLKKDEEWVVNNSSLVAWNCQYSIESAEQCILCHFKGPGTVFTQIQNPVAFFNWFAHNVPDDNDTKQNRALGMIDKYTFT